MLMYSKERCTRFASVAGAVVLLLQGCSNFSALSKHSEIAVGSEPSGASVYVMGKVLGSTPLVVRHQDVFPVVYTPDQQDLYGMVILKKDGCQDYLQQVNSTILKRGVKAKLDCTKVSAQKKSTQTQIPQVDQPSIRAPAPIPQVDQPSIRVPAPAPMPTSIKQRLIRIDELHQDGLITDEEYGAARRRILDEL